MKGREAEDERRFTRALEAVVAELGVEVENGAWTRLIGHYRLLRLWGARMNLTAIREPEEIAERHFGESLYLWRELGLEKGCVADVGSGAGFPGLPIAAMAPEVCTTLVECVVKKAVFLSEVSRSWDNVDVFADRVENFCGRTQWALARGVAPEAILPCLARIAPRAALLVGEDTVHQLGECRDFEWGPPRALPWGRRRRLVFGVRVPRETELVASRST